MARYLFIVSREHAALHDYLIERFSGDENVQVILDRRVGGRALHPEGEGWTVNRRSRPDVDEEMRSSSHAIVILD
jgi:hypothetical protein